MTREIYWVQVLGTLAARGMTQEQIASACGSSQTTISEIARGSTKQPSFALGSALLELLDADDGGPDWRVVIKSLTNKGYSKADLARACKVTPPTITDLSTGKYKKTDYAIGAKLISMLDTAPLQPESVTLTVAGLEVTITVKPMEAHNK